MDGRWRGDKGEEVGGVGKTGLPPPVAGEEAARSAHQNPRRCVALPPYERLRAVHVGEGRTNGEN